MALEPWEIEVGLNAAGIHGDNQKVITDAIPIAVKLVGHIKDNIAKLDQLKADATKLVTDINANLALLETLYADMKLILPAASMALNAVNQGEQS